MAYKAFLSYSHVDGKLAASMHSALQSFAQPILRRRVIRIFRDKVSVSASPALWPSIERALESSEYFLLLTSREAAQSPWVNREVAWWIKHRSVERMFILVTHGEIHWDNSTGDFDWTSTTCLPAVLQGQFKHEPLYVDLRWTRKPEERFSLRNPRFRQAVLDIAAPLHGKPTDELDGDDVRRRRRAKRFVAAAIGTLLVLSYFVERQRNIAFSRELAFEALAQLERDPELSLLLAQEALRSAPTSEAEEALVQSLSESRVRAVIRPNRGALSSSAFSPDGTLVVTVGADAIAELWQTDTGKHVRDVDQGKSGNVTFSSDGRAIISTANDVQTVSAVDPASDTPFRVKSGQCYSPDAKLVVVADENRPVEIRETRSGKLAATLPFKLDGEPCVFSDDGRHIAVGSGDDFVLVFDARTGREVSKLQGFGPSFSHDGRFIATHVYLDERWGLRTWQVDTGRLVSSPIPSAESVRKLIFSPNGDLLAAIDPDGPLTIYVTASGRIAFRTAGHTKAVTNANFSPDGKLISTVSEDGTARVWTAETGEAVAVLRGHQGRINDAQFSPNGVFLVTAGVDGTARVWAVMPLEEGVKELRGHSDSVMNTAFSPDGSLALTGSADGTARLWRMPNGEEVDPALKHAGPVLSAIFSPDGKSILTVTRERIATVWDTSNHQRLNETQLQQPTCPVPKFSPDGNLVIGTVKGNTQRIWSAKTGQEVARISVESHPTSCEMQFTPDSKGLIAIGTDGEVRFWPIGGVQPTQTPVAALPNVSAAAFSPGGELIATAGSDNAIQVWNISRRRNLFDLPANEKTVRSLAFSPDKRRLLAISQDPTVRIWEIGTPGREVVLNLRTPPPPEYGAIYQRAAEFSRNGNFVLTSNSDKNFVQVWRATGLPLVDFGESNFGDHIATFSPDAKLVMIARNASAKIYECHLCGSVDSLLKLAHTRVTRSLTDTERKRYLGLLRFLPE